MRIAKKGSFSIVNVFGFKTTETDRELFHNWEINIGTVVHLESLNEQMADLLVMIGKFDSKTIARKNGYNSVIPFGYHELRIGRGSNTLILNIFNPSKSIEEYEC